ncbi:MAG TPA: SgcJ/EcaC family oxidoreductase [Pseudonocardiaceae bacterium]|jgi:uncharacterized protein (TIGR02246 family)|nr:SgcJ/EcaC family oxidoreductase [Pseudonocardiaceae bacterium]
MTEPDAADVAALDALLRGLIDAWNAGDLEAYARPFTDDAVYVTYFGRKLMGREGIAEGHRRVFAGAYRGSRLLNAQASYRFLRPDVVVAVQDGGVETAPGASPEDDQRNTLTYVLVKDDGEWEIASFHNARVSNPEG